MRLLNQSLMTAVAYETSAPLTQTIAPRRASSGGSGLPFALFILVNAALFVRPAELIPAAQGLPIYNLIIMACLAVSISRVFNQLNTRNVIASPINACVIGLFF